MEGFGFSDASSAVRKRRNTARRPRNESQLPHENYDNISSLSSTPPSDTNLNGGFGESDEASNNDSYRGSNDPRLNDSKRCSEGVLSPANWKSTNSFSNLGVASGVGENENKVKKVKLKVGGITHTINTKTASDGASAVGSSSTKSSHYVGSRKKSVEDENRSYTSYKDLRGAPWTNISDGGLSVGIGEISRSMMPGDSISGKQTNVSEPVRKSKRVTKKHTLDGDVGEDDDEIRYLEKVKRSKAIVDSVVDCEDEEGKNRKHQKISKVLKRNVDGLYSTSVGDYGILKSVKEVKRSNLAQDSEDVDYLEEEETGSDGEPASKKNKLKKELIDILEPSKKETTITTRQRGRDASSTHGASIIEFPNGLPPAPPKKQKEKLTEMEQQLKRAEALQRRRMQVEKANRESEAEAIRKILGQDSSRKKREVKLKKKQEEMQQEKAANAMALQLPTSPREMYRSVVLQPLQVQGFQVQPPTVQPPMLQGIAGSSARGHHLLRYARTATMARIRALDYVEDDFEV